MKYSPEGNFPLHSLITHPILGTGKVVKHIPPNKMDVKFGEEIKCLVCGKISRAASIEQNTQSMKSLPYSPYGIFQVGDIVEHRDFGIGIVINYIHPTRIDIKFLTGVRRLKCGRHPRNLNNSYTSFYANPKKNNESVFVAEERNTIQELHENVVVNSNIDVEDGNKVKCIAGGRIQNDYDKKIAQQTSPPLEYSPDRIFPVECVIKHNILGIGEVVRYANQNEIDVKFPNETVRLICGKLPESLLKKYSSPLSSQNKDIVPHLTAESHNVTEEHLKNIANDIPSHLCEEMDGMHSALKGAGCLAGLDPNDTQSEKNLQQLLDEWDYSTEASAQIAYNKPCIERLQLLRQIAGLLQNGTGFSQLYNMLEPRRGQFERGKAYSAGKTLQPWTGLVSSIRLRSFVEEHEDFLCGRVINGKWVPGSSPCDSGSFNYTIGKELPETPPWSNAFTEKLAQILSMRFPNGYRLDSPIELARFRSFAVEILDKEIILPDEDLKKRISACGITYDGKVYAVSTQAEERIKEIAEQYFADGAQVIFFAEFYAKNETWLFDASIISELMLLGILSRLFPKLSFTQAYFGHTTASVSNVLENELLRVWGDDVLLTYEQIAERLQYIPIERIRSILGKNRDFIWHSVGTFSHVSRIVISDKERETICKAIVQECNAKGYASLATLPTAEIEALNDELSISAVHSAIFHICLSDEFDNYGKIVTRKGDIIDALTIMKEHCRTINKCSLDDLLNYGKALTGDVRLTAMEAGNTILVRIDRDTYVSDKHVYFDSDTVDAAIEIFINGNYLPFKSFTTFGIFPDCGQTWNLFLLESYCRRFSKKFRFDSLSMNSQNIGVVIRRNCTLKYIEVMADAVANIGIPLTNSNVGDFLLNSGYIGRRRPSIIGEVITKANASQKRVD